ncbi:MAG TPA: hypothetical protein VNT02_05550 [Burkholderiales bacterium]|nr:hypothetical protein [Burkholderiales bacterium]
MRAYAERGVFRALDVRAGAKGALEFKLQWLTDVPVRLHCDGRLLTLKNLLPNVSRRSLLYADLERFIAERFDRSVPAHRRIDRASLDVAWTVNRKQASLVVKVKKGDPAIAVKRIVNLMHELFVYLQDSWAEYMWSAFGTSTE